MRSVPGRSLVTGTDAVLRATVGDGASLGGGATVRLVPVNPPSQVAPYPPGTIVDEANQHISIPGGTARRIWVEPRFSNWGCCGDGVNTFQGAIDPLPLGLDPAEESCVDSADCAAFGFANPQGACDSNSICRPGFYDFNHPLDTDPEIVAIGRLPQIACGWTHVGGKLLPDTGSEGYGCTLAVDTEPGFVGTIELPFQGLNTQTFMQITAGITLPITLAIPATIEVLGGAFCCDAGACSFIDPPGDCVALGLTPAGGTCLGDCDNNGVDDVCQGMADCNGNGVADMCDVTSGFSDDCNNNLTPDECESQADCDNNGIQDVCDVFDREANDCNFNDIPDTCDIASGNDPDDNGNGVIDYCEQRSRFVFFDAPSGEVAIRVKFLNLDGFEGSNGEVRWLGAASEFPNGAAPDMFWASQAECSEVLTTWPVGQPLYVHGSSIVPSSDYEIRFADAACLALGVESCMSAPIVRSTSFWADVRIPYFGHPSTAEPTFVDIGELVRAFEGDASAVHYTRVRLAGDTMDLNIAISFTDIAASVASFEGQSYPHGGPDVCP